MKNVFEWLGLTGLQFVAMRGRFLPSLQASLFAVLLSEEVCSDCVDMIILDTCLFVITLKSFV